MTRRNPSARLDRIARARALIWNDQRFEPEWPEKTFTALQDLGATVDFFGGTYRLRYCGITGTATSGSPDALLRSWSRAAGRALARAPSHQPSNQTQAVELLP